MDDLIEQAFFFGDYSELRKIWNALRDDEKSEVETAEKSEVETAEKSEVETAE